MTENESVFVSRSNTICNGKARVLSTDEKGVMREYMMRRHETKGK
jgi:hypothetical protein